MTTTPGRYVDPYAPTLPQHGGPPGPPDRRSARSGTGTTGLVFAIVFGAIATGCLVLAAFAAALGTSVFDPAHPLRPAAALASHPEFRSVLSDELAGDLAVSRDALEHDLEAILTDPRFLDTLHDSRGSSTGWDPDTLQTIVADVLDDYAATPRAPGGLTTEQLGEMADEFRATDSAGVDVTEWSSVMGRLRLGLWLVAGAVGLFGALMALAAVGVVGSGRRGAAAGSVALAVGVVGTWCLHPVVSLPLVGWFTDATAAVAWMLDPAATASFVVIALVGAVWPLRGWVRRQATAADATAPWAER